MFAKHRNWINFYNDSNKMFYVFFMKKTRVDVINEFEQYFDHRIAISKSEFGIETFEDPNNKSIFFICSKEKYNNHFFKQAKRKSFAKKVMVFIYDDDHDKKVLTALNSLTNDIKCTLKSSTAIIGFSLLTCILLGFSLVFGSLQHTRALYSPIQSISETITRGTGGNAIWDINFSEKAMDVENKSISDYIYRNYSHYQWSNRRTYYDARVLLRYAGVNESLELITMDQDDALINPDFCYFDFKCLTSNLFYGYRNSSDNCVITKTIADSMFDSDAQNNNYDNLIKKTISINIGEKKYDFLITAVVDDTDKSFSCLNSLVGNKCVFIQTKKVIESTASANIITYGNDGTQKEIIQYLVDKDDGIIDKATIRLSGSTMEYDFLDEYKKINGQKTLKIIFSIAVDFLLVFLYFVATLITFKIIASFYQLKNNHFKTFLFFFITSVFLYICSFVQNTLNPVNLTSKTISYSSNTASCIFYIVAFAVLFVAYLIAFGLPRTKVSDAKVFKYHEIEI